MRGVITRICLSDEVQMADRLLSMLVVKTRSRFNQSEPRRERPAGQIIQAHRVCIYRLKDSSVS